MFVNVSNGWDVNAVQARQGNQEFYMKESIGGQISSGV